MPDIKGTLFWLAIVLLLLFLMMRGCGRRMDKFREYRDDRREDRQERFDDRHDQRQERFDDRRDGRQQRIDQWRKDRRRFSYDGTHDPSLTQ